MIKTSEGTRGTEQLNLPQGLQTDNTFTTTSRRI